MPRKIRTVININVPVVFMARYIMVLRGATSLQGALEGVGPENRDFFGPKKVEWHCCCERTVSHVVVLKGQYHTLSF